MQQYPQQPQQYQPQQPQQGGETLDMENNNTIIISSSAQNLSLDANNNNNTTFIPPNHTATTNVVPSTYRLGSMPPHHQGYIPMATTTTGNTMGGGLSYTQGVSAPYVMKGGKGSGLNSPLTQQQQQHNNNNNTTNLMMGGQPMMSNGATQMMGVPPPPLHNGASTTTYVSSPLPSATMQNQNQPMYTVHGPAPSGPQFVQHMSNQPREIVQI